MRKFVGKVSLDERDEILHLYKKKCTLEELLLVDELNGPLSEKVRHDLSDVENLYQMWWDSTAQKYNWEKASGKTWTVDFESCDVFLDL